MKTKYTLLTMVLVAGGFLLLAGCPRNLAEITKAAYAYVDDNGDGICDTCGQGVDEDGDGVCDNFIDENDDGICDNRQSHRRLGWNADGYMFQDSNGDGICDLCGGASYGDGVCENFIDVDGDGVCDNRQSHVRRGLGAGGYQFRDANGDGLCDLCDGQDADGDGVCDNFVDEDGDGVCDLRASHARYGWGAQGFQFQDGNGDGVCDRCGGADADGDGVCDNFVDADGDGICDNHNSHEQHGNGSGHGGNGNGNGGQNG